MAAFSLLILGISPLRADERREEAQSAVTAMAELLETGDFGKFYKTWCPAYVRDEITEIEFIDLMGKERGESIVALLTSAAVAIERNEGEDVLIARPHPEERDSFEFIVVVARDDDSSATLWRIALSKEGDRWKLKDVD